MVGYQESAKGQRHQFGDLLWGEYWCFIFGVFVVAPVVEWYFGMCRSKVWEVFDFVKFKVGLGVPGFEGFDVFLWPGCALHIW